MTARGASPLILLAALATSLGSGPDTIEYELHAERTVLDALTGESVPGAAVELHGYLSLPEDVRWSPPASRKQTWRGAAE